LSKVAFHDRGKKLTAENGTNIQPGGRLITQMNYDSFAFLKV
jgi:hypothetical protein